MKLKIKYLTILLACSPWGKVNQVAQFRKIAKKHISTMMNMPGTLLHI